mgnify:CR=1 FL=1
MFVLSFPVILDAKIISQSRFRDIHNDFFNTIFQN